MTMVSQAAEDEREERVAHLDVGEVDVERQLLAVLIDVLLDGARFGIASGTRVIDASRDIDPRDAVDLHCGQFRWVVR